MHLAKETKGNHEKKRNSCAWGLSSSSAVKFKRDKCLRCAGCKEKKVFGEDLEDSLLQNQIIGQIACPLKTVVRC